MTNKGGGQAPVGPVTARRRRAETRGRTSHVEGAKPIPKRVRPPLPTTAQHIGAGRTGIITTHNPGQRVSPSPARRSSRRWASASPEHPARRRYLGRPLRTGCRTQRGGRKHSRSAPCLAGPRSRARTTTVEPAAKQSSACLGVRSTPPNPRAVEKYARSVSSTESISVPSRSKQDSTDPRLGVLCTHSHRRPGWRALCHRVEPHRTTKRAATQGRLDRAHRNRANVG